MRIIVAEDEPRALKGLCSLITAAGKEYEVIARASDGRQALEIVPVLKPDVVFTDIRMPFLDGLELIRALQKYNLRTKYVITSAFAEFEYAQKAIQVGVNEYLLKPLTLEDVTSVLNTLKAEIDGTGRKAPNRKTAEQYPDAHYMVVRAIEMVEDGYSSKISQETIAECLGMTQEYFSYLFHKDTKIKFSDFVRDYRIGVAKQLLSEPGCRVQEVSYAVGYTDPKYFSKIFRKATGLTPLEYSRQRGLLS